MYRGIARTIAPMPASKASSESQGCASTCFRWNQKRSASVLMSLHSRCSACPIMRSPNGNCHHVRQAYLLKCRGFPGIFISQATSLPVPASVMNAVLRFGPPKQMLEGSGSGWPSTVNSMKSRMAPVGETTVIPPGTSASRTLRQHGRRVDITLFVHCHGIESSLPRNFGGQQVRAVERLGVGLDDAGGRQFPVQNPSSISLGDIQPTVVGRECDAVRRRPVG